MECEHLSSQIASESRATMPPFTRRTDSDVGTFRLSCQDEQKRQVHLPNIQVCYPAIHSTGVIGSAPYIALDEQGEEYRDP